MRSTAIGYEETRWDRKKSSPIDGKTQPTRERIMRDLYELLKDGKCPTYTEIRRTQHKSIHSER